MGIKRFLLLLIVLLPMLVFGQTVQVNQGAQTSSGVAGAITIGGDLGGTPASPEVIGILTHPIPAVTQGCLHWNGTALEWLNPCGGGGGGAQADWNATSGAAQILNKPPFTYNATYNAGAGLISTTASVFQLPYLKTQVSYPILSGTGRLPLADNDGDVVAGPRITFLTPTNALGILADVSVDNLLVDQVKNAASLATSATGKIIAGTGAAQANWTAASGPAQILNRPNITQTGNVLNTMGNAFVIEPAFIDLTPTANGTDPQAGVYVWSAFQSGTYLRLTAGNVYSNGNLNLTGSTGNLSITPNGFSTTSALFKFGNPSFMNTRFVQFDTVSDNTGLSTGNGVLRFAGNLRIVPSLSDYTRNLNISMPAGSDPEIVSSTNLLKIPGDLALTSLTSAASLATDATGKIIAGTGGGGANPIRICAMDIDGGSGPTGQLQVADSLIQKCFNDFGHALTILAVHCWTEEPGGGSTQIMPKTSNIGYALLTTPLFCANDWPIGNLNGTPQITVGDAFDMMLSPDGNATHVHVAITMQ